jgi:tRNA pseudouridine55 synthase
VTGTLVEKEALNGLLLVDKPSGPTSYDIIRWVKRSAKGAKIGHSGTLDPLASGLLILLFGRATKSQAAVMGQEKTYRFVMRLGTKTDTGDITGSVVATKPVPTFDETVLRNLFGTFLGAQSQTPPMYSAIKQAGVPLYKRARKGETVERAARAIQIHALDLLRIVSPTDVECRARCSSGTYIRTLVEDMGERLGTVGTMAALVRESIGDFQLDDAVGGEVLKNMTSADIAAHLRKIG